MIFDSRTNVINDRSCIFCIASCILERYNDIACRYIITSRTIKVSCICTIWTFNYFSAISFCVNCWSYSIYSICFLTCCSIRCFRYSYIIASFNDCAKTSDYILTCIIDVGKILFSNASDFSFSVSYWVTIAINVSHCYATIVLYSIATWFDVFFIIKSCYSFSSCTTVIRVCNAVAIFLNCSCVTSCIL